MKHKGLRGDLTALRQTVRDELEAAYQARAEDQEGRARVCARRAAGWGVSIMRSQNEGGEVEANAYDMLQWLAQQTDTPDSVQAAAMRLTTRVSYDHTLPFPEDPIEDALMIVESVLGENWNEQGDDRLSGS